MNKIKNKKLVGLDYSFLSFTEVSLMLRRYVRGVNKVPTYFSLDSIMTLRTLRRGGLRGKQRLPFVLLTLSYVTLCFFDALDISE